jgi:hypothetical protein
MKSIDIDYSALYGEPVTLTDGTYKATIEPIPSAITPTVLMVRCIFEDGAQEVQSYRRGTTDEGVVYDLISQFAKNLCRQTGLSFNDAMAYAKDNPILVDVKVTDSGLINIIPKASNRTTSTTVEVSEEDLENVF